MKFKIILKVPIQHSAVSDFSVLNSFLMKRRRTHHDISKYSTEMHGRIMVGWHETIALFEFLLVAS